MNAHIATKLSGLVMQVLRATPPSLPRRGVPLPSVLGSKERGAKEEYLRYIKWRHRRGLTVLGDTRHVR